jgi:hypothetical protein
MRGSVKVLYCIQVARMIDLRAGMELLTRSRPAGLRHKTRVLSQGSPILPPLRLDWPGPGQQGPAPAAISIGGWTTSGTEVAIYEQGVLGVTWTIDFSGTVDELVDFAAMLYDNETLRGASREVAGDILASLEGAALRGGVEEDLEDYVLFELPTVEPEAMQFVDQRRSDLARVLRAERRALSEQEIADAVAECVSYTPQDLCVVDWLGAVLLGTDTEDERQILELATVQLLALRILDRKLARSTQEAYALLLKPRPFAHVFGPARRDLARVAVMQTDDALIHEAIDNALKVIGDDYLARLFATAGRRFRFGVWDAAIERKLEVLGSVYERLSDQASHRRSELLEWIIILLIAAEIGMTLAKVA